MNMLIRFFIMVSLLKQQLKQQLTSESLSVETLTVPIVRHYRVLPHDMGFRDHLPNYRYLSFIELNITPISPLVGFFIPAGISIPLTASLCCWFSTDLAPIAT